MNVRLHPHAQERIQERGASEAEVMAAVREGKSSPARFGRTRFVKEFATDTLRRGRPYSYKKIEAFAVPENEGWLVITVLVKFF